MQGKRTGVATRLREEKEAALPVHCLAYSLKPLLTRHWQEIQVIRNSMHLVREIVKLKDFSPRWKILFGAKLADNDQGWWYDHSSSSNTVDSTNGSIRKRH